MSTESSKLTYYLNRAKESYQNRSFEEAEALLGEALLLDEANANVHAQRCEVLRCLGRLPEAEAAARRALAVDRNNADALYNLSVVCGQLGRRPEAIELLRSVLALQPDNADALYNLGVLHDLDGHLQLAEAGYRQALAAGSAGARRNLASVLFDRGEHEESARLYASIIAANPLDVDAHFAYSRLVTYREDDRTLAALQQLTARGDELGPDQRIKLCFTVGKANQDIGDYASAYAAFSTGNRMHYARFPYDEHGNYAMLDDLRRRLDTAFFDTAPASGNTADMPIFVLGMPRSGSTLVEQILASHSEVSGAGELKYLKQVIQSHLIGDKRTFANAVPGWTASSFRDAAADYLSRLDRHAGGRARVVDKMPGNFAFVGLIAKLFPNAFIVHTTRHPMATVWSCYSTHFGDALHYTYDLQVLTRYYRKYRETMTHWDAVLPPGRVFRVDYEQLVRHPEQTVRALLEHLGLAWEPACLRFHENRRDVRTASVAQVRRPLYTSALEMWSHYREQLTPYRRELSPDQKNASSVTP